jgi:hypothetical protein
MNEQTQQRIPEQPGGDQDEVQGYLPARIPIAAMGVLPGGQPPSAGNPGLAGRLIREGLIVLDGPSGVPPLPNPFQGPRINW